MIETLKKYKTLLSIVVIVVIVFMGYSIVFDGGSNDNVLTSQNISVRGGGDNELLLLL